MKDLFLPRPTQDEVTFTTMQSEVYGTRWNEENTKFRSMESLSYENYSKGNQDFIIYLRL